MVKKEILALISASRLPGDLKEYFARAIVMKTPSGLKAALREAPAAFIENFESLLAAACAALGCPKGEVLFVTGFNKNDMAPERFGAALAELKAALFLAREGFSGLSLLRQSRCTGADLCAKRGENDYIFEVRCLRGGGPLDYLLKKNAAREKPRKAAVEYLGLKYDKKIRQVNSSRKRTGLRYGGVILALDPASFSGGPGAPALRELAAALYLAKNSPPCTHIALLAGPAGAVYPEWRR